MLGAFIYTTMLEAVNGAFEALLFGSGSWLGILLLVSIIVALLLKWPYIGALLLPVTIFVGIEYVGKDLAWHSIIMFLTGIFTLFYMAKELRGRR